jgi:trimeric autotransporter adhesin
MRLGDFSRVSVSIIDPISGQPFPGNQIPTERIDATALSLLRFIPSANLTGAAKNYRALSTTHTTSDSVTLRIRQNLSAAGAPLGPGAGRLGAAAGSSAAPGGRRQRGLNLTMLNVQLQYRHTQSDTPNVFPELGGQNTNSNLSLPVTLLMARGQAMHNLSVNVTSASATTRNHYANSEDIAAASGISGASTDPAEWGVPNLTFSTFSSLRDVVPSRRVDRRLNVTYSVTRRAGTHRIMFGGGYGHDWSLSQNDSNARGTFVFTGAHAAGAAPFAARNGADFADFLLGMPQQANVQYGPGQVRLRRSSFNAFLEDNWQKGQNLTFNIGLRYEFIAPYSEAGQQMANLDITPGFTAAVPVLAGDYGPFTGTFPTALIKSDKNNLAPRIGLAYALTPTTVVRSGYGVTFNSGSYTSIARQLTQQPPFAVTNTVLGSVDSPLATENALLLATGTTTNTYGVDKNYALGAIHTWNASVSKDLFRNWSATAGYTGTQGNNLDLIRAPNREPDGGFRIEGVQPFLWHSSGGHSILHSTNIQLRRRFASGIGAGVSYTLAKSMDNAPNLGAAVIVVAQNDRDLDAEWALSNFDRRHQLSADLMWQLPFGPDRPWLNNGGPVAALVGEWLLTLNLAAQSGTPSTARILGAATDILSGINGTLRADYTGAPIDVPDPTVDQFFNTSAFAVPSAGMFGNAGRNTIIGPASSQLDASLSRDMRTGGSRVLTLQVNATNLLNRPQWASVDTTVNSPTFGQVTSIRPMRSVTASLRFRF